MAMTTTITDLLREARADERERCAKIADGLAERLNAARTKQGFSGGEPNAYESACKQVAAAIRAGRLV